MSADRDPELEAMLRRALADEADRVEPSPDGLSRIRRRASARPSWQSRWLVPGLALAGAAAVIAGIAVLPSVLTRDSGGTTPAAGSPAVTASAAGTPTGSATPSPTATSSPSPRSPASSRPPSSPPPPSSPTPTAIGTATPTRSEVNDMSTVWPYASRREGNERADADIAAGVYPDLRNPALTAVDFVALFAGRDGLTASRLGAYPPGLRMLVSRNGRPVSTVFLVRVRAGDDAPYVVVGASRATIDPADTLTISAPPAVAGTEPVSVGGLLRRPAGSAEQTVTVELREPGQDGTLARTTVPVQFAGAVVSPWSGVLTPVRKPATTGVVAAWTVDADGGVLEFVAAPTAG